MIISDSDSLHQFNRLIACLAGFKRLPVSRLAQLLELKAEYSGVHLATQKQDILEKLGRFIRQLRIKSHTKDDLLEVLACVTDILDDSITIKPRG